MPLTDSGRASFANFALAIAAVLLVALLLFAASSTPLISEVDVDYSERIHRFALEQGWPLNSAEALTWLGNPLVLSAVVVAVALFLAATRRFKLAVWLVVTTVLGAAIETGLKLGFRRARPDLDTATYTARGYSFPSGHAMNSTITFLAVATCLALALGINNKARLSLAVPAIIIALTAGLTRPMLGVHYFSDVSAGWILGALWIVLVMRRLPPNASTS